VYTPKGLIIPLGKYVTITITTVNDYFGIEGFRTPLANGFKLFNV